MIGFIGAMEIEINGIRQKMTEKQTTKISGIEFVTGKLNSAQIVTAVCGIGKVFAAICTQTMILQFSPTLIINTGVAGSLSESLNIGDIAIAEKVVQHDMDTSPIGDPRGLLSGINVIYIETDKKASMCLTECINEFNINTVTGIIASGDQFIASREKKEDIKSTFSAIAAEMECASIGHVCYVNNVPFAVLRAISDCANAEATVDFPTFAKQAAENYIKVVSLFTQKYPKV